MNESEWRRLDCLLWFALALYRWLLVFQVSHFLQVWGVLRSRFVLSFDVLCFIILLSPGKVFIQYLITYIYSLKSLIPRILRFILCFVHAVMYILGTFTPPLLKGHRNKKMMNPNRNMHDFPRPPFFLPNSNVRLEALGNLIKCGKPSMWQTINPTPH